MKKILLALPLIAGASWAGSTFYAGTQAQPAYEKLLSQLNEQAAGVLVFESKEYNAGFTHSTALTNITVHNAPETQVLQLQHDISHSPIGSDPQGARFSASSITTRLLQDSIESEQGKEVLAGFDGGEPFVLYTDVAFNGSTFNDLQLSSFSMRSERGSFTFDGGRYEITGQNDKVDITGILGEFKFIDATNNTVSVAESSTNFDLLMVGKGVFTGEQTVTFPSVTISNNGLDAKLDDIVLRSMTSLNGEKLNSETGFSIASISSPMPLNSLSWDFALNGMSVEGLEHYIATMNQISSLSEDELQEIGFATLMTQLRDGFSSLAPPGTEFSNKLTLTNDGGDLVNEIDLTFLGDGSDSGIDSMLTVGDLLQAINVNMELEADAPAISMTPAAMFMMHPMAQQYIINDGEKYTSNINIANLMLDINGTLQPLDQLMGDTLDIPLDFSSAMADF
ncbi:hypothetical protein AB833_13025 [Chromatiales bacterium (ex Bugula neritina AB1)]|nr:hypothetical protein AB833_13025 [Chromatiales bacterium (ex Bugula neritina AB1)]